MRKPRLELAPIREAIEKTLEGEKRPEAEVSALVVSDTRIRALNRRYREIDSPTDVLSFPMADGEFANLHPDVLGDIVISVDRAESQAKAAGHSLMDELKLLAIHGTLHLLGFEDETAPGRAKMLRLARRYLRRVETR
ncbi:MAG: rRNA maturation RNase YbeY [Candidatus Lindowbacteria bacterium]|nr:rRNA maturation RNase YbeY [Candidatus Lindowbacteria bacterium]